MGSNATAQSGLRLLFAINHFTPTSALIGFCEQLRLSMDAMDGLSFQSCSTIGHLMDMIVIVANIWRLCGGVSGTVIGHAKH
eukprot:7854434-Pyramimonas_sp.AAC.2